MNILHLGVFDRNTGDNIALAHLQYSLNQYVGDVKVYKVNLETFWRYNNSLEYTRSIYNKLVDNIDCIVVGGGGLIEYTGYEKKASGWKLPFWEETLRFIKKPIYFYGVGVNSFRGHGGYSDQAIQALTDTINHASGFAVRNDGSYDKLDKWIGLDKETLSKVDIVPDPGLLHLDSFNIPKKDSVTKLGFQPAINVSGFINNNRFGTEKNLKKLKDRFRNTPSFPHTDKDFAFGKPVITRPEFLNYYKKFDNFNKFLPKYSEIDFVVAMRGHGQMITMGMNIPGIYLSTQDKVRDFSVKNGFEDYDVDMREDNWYEKLEECINRMQEPNSEYLKNWYSIRDKFIKNCHDIDEKWIKTNFKEWIA